MILVQAYNNSANTNTVGGGISVESKGSFRFVIKNMTRTFPYPIVIVDELLEDCIDSSGDNNISPAATTAIKGRRSVPCVNLRRSITWCQLLRKGEL